MLTEKDIILIRLYHKIRIPSDQILVMGKLAEAFASLFSEYVDGYCSPDEIRYRIINLRKSNKLGSFKDSKVKLTFKGEKYNALL
tara:strand:- start:4404 stop:4658 length:255 start_codon:yes stop_codon:yes gene_type:complete